MGSTLNANLENMATEAPKRRYFVNGWTPLYHSLVGSSVWGAPDHVRIAWITLLAITGRDGVAHVTTGGLARLANITPEKAVDALKVLSEPDDDTLTQEHEGRRIRRVASGYELLNWEKYRVMAKRAIVAEQNREAQRKWREQQKQQEALATAEARVEAGLPPGPEPPAPPKVRSTNRPECVQDVIEKGGMIGLPEAECRKFWDHYEGSATEDENGKPIWMTGEKGETRIGSWQSKLSSWKSRWEEKRLHPGTRNPGTGAQPITDEELQRMVQKQNEHKP